MPLAARRRLWARLSGAEELRASYPAGHYASLASTAGVPRTVLGAIETDTRTLSGAFKPHPLLKQPATVGAKAGEGEGK